MSEQYSQEVINEMVQNEVLMSLRSSIVELNQYSIKGAKKTLYQLNIEHFIQFIVQLVDKQILQKLDLFLIFEDLYECAPEGSLESLFSLMEAQILQNKILGCNETMEEKQLLSFCSKICKMIMKKLSVTKDTKFRGRVQTLIAVAFPLTHPSGLNRSGLFNTKNSTEYQSLEDVKKELTEQRGGKSVQVSDYKIYKNFWNLQKYLTNPFQIFTNETLGFEEQWEQEQDIHQNIEGNHLEAINGDQEMSFGDGEEEEGQADIEQSLQTNSQPNKQKEESNLQQVLVTINDYLNRFLSQPLNVDKDNAQILRKYPKYLSKYSLLNLQFQDFLFRETFLVQVLIFLQTIQSPINPQQKKHFVLTEKDKNKMQEVQEKVNQLLQDKQIEQSNQEKLQKSMKDCVKTILDREENWNKWKENKCFNFERKANKKVTQKSQAFRKREVKQVQKLLHKQPELKGQAANLAKNGIQMQQLLKMNMESIHHDNFDIKKGEISTLNQYVNSLCLDMDPEQGIEDQYKHKHDQVFCWRFLRILSLIDLVNFHGKPDSQRQFNKFEGNVEEQTQILQNKAPKRAIVKEVENGDSWQDDQKEEEEKEHNGNGESKVNGK